MRSRDHVRNLFRRNNWSLRSQFDVFIVLNSIVISLQQLSLSISVIYQMHCFVRCHKYRHWESEKFWRDENNSIANSSIAKWLSKLVNENSRNLKTFKAISIFQNHDALLYDICWLDSTFKWRSMIWYRLRLNNELWELVWDQDDWIVAFFAKFWVIWKRIATHWRNFIIVSTFRLIATSQELEKYQKLDLKKSSQVLKVELEACLDVKFKSLILASNSNSSRNFRLETWLDIKSSFRLELEAWLEKLDLTWNIIYKKYQKWLFSL